MLLAIIYALASLTQVIVGHFIDRFAIKRLYLVMVLAQIPWLMFAALAQGGWLFWALLGAMIFVFGCTPFTDAMIVKYVDDRMRSRIAGMRLAVAFEVSSLAVWLLGPMVQAFRFGSLFIALALVSLGTASFVLLLPSEQPAAKASQGPSPTNPSAAG